MKKLLFPLLVLPSLIFSNQAFSQISRTFMKVTAPSYNFDGGVKVKGFERQIELFSFSDGIQGCTSTSSNGAQSGACKPSFSGFQTIIPLSLAVTDFRSVMIQGKLLTTVDVVGLKPSGGILTAYYKIHMENVLVNSVQEGASEESPTISVGLSPQKIAWQVISQNADGSPGPSSSFGWDFAKNSAFNFSF